MIGQGKRFSDTARTRYQAFQRSLPEVKRWRRIEHDAGRPSSLQDYFRARGLCFACRSTGTNLTPTGWDGEVALYQPCHDCGGTGKRTGTN
jgi:hypothetical protein